MKVAVLACALLATAIVSINAWAWGHRAHAAIDQADERQVDRHLALCGGGGL